jgi:cytochrome c2
MVRSALVVLLLLLILLTLPARVQAGGWAVVTLDTLPSQVVAGEPVAIGFFVRQHGHTPVIEDRMAIYARHSGSGERLEIFALPEGEPGHYQAEVVFPTGGTWEWEIEIYFYPGRQPMPDLTVLGDNPAPPPSRPDLPLLPLILAAVSLGAGALAILRRGRLRWALAIASFAGLIALVGVLSSAGWVTVAQADERPETQAVLGQTDYGRDLFVAKGCVLCHVHDRVGGPAASLSIDYGPELSTYRADPDYLHTWLKSPTAIKPETEMPELGLKKDEIEALIAFINAE